MTACSFKLSSAWPSSAPSGPLALIGVYWHPTIAANSPFHPTFGCVPPSVCPVQIRKHKDETIDSQGQTLGLQSSNLSCTCGQRTSPILLVIPLPILPSLSILFPRGDDQTRIPSPGTLPRYLEPSDSFSCAASRSSTPFSGAADAGCWEVL